MKLKIFSLLLIVAFSFAMCPFSSNAYEASSDFWQDVSFFGDSTTHGLIHYIVNQSDQRNSSYDFIKRDQILTPPNGTFYLRNLPTARILYQGETFALDQAIQKAAPKILIVTVGVNGLQYWNKDCFVELYNRLLDLFSSASPETLIVLQSIFPTAKIRSKHLAQFTVERIDAVNEWIREIALSRNLIYINSADALKGEDGWLRKEYQNGDGLHLNTAGFHQVLTSIEKTLQNQKGYDFNL